MHTDPDVTNLRSLLANTLMAAALATLPSLAMAAPQPIPLLKKTTQAQLGSIGTYGAGPGRNLGGGRRCDFTKSLLFGDQYRGP